MDGHIWGHGVDRRGQDGVCTAFEVGRDRSSGFGPSTAAVTRGG